MTAKITTTADSPWFSGHFPGNPILPGIAQLAMLTDVVSRLNREPVSVKRLSRVKFRRVIRPGEALDIRITVEKTMDQYSFQITSHQERVSSGIIYLTNNTSISSS